MSFALNSGKVAGRVYFSRGLLSKSLAIQVSKGGVKCLQPLSTYAEEKPLTLSSLNQTVKKYHTTSIRYKDAASGGQIPGLFSTLSKAISPELINQTQAVFQFNVKGAEEGIWHLDLKNGDGSCGQGEPKNAPDATLTMDSKNLTAMFAGKLKPTNAFMMGKLKISGDLKKAMKLEAMLKSLKA